MSKRLPIWFVLLLGGCIGAGIGLRVAAVGWNDAPHGDVHLDVQTLDEFWRTGELRTPLERSVALYPPVDEHPGYPMDQHPPLALLLAAALEPVLPGPADPYLALRLISLLAGLALLPLVVAAARRLGLEPWTPCALTAASFLLADFSGNGSIYTLHAALGVALLVLLAPSTRGPSRLDRAAPLLAGGCAGFAWLANYQALAFLPALLLALLFAPGTPPSRRFARAALALLAFALVVLPWCVRNFAVFGDPLFTVNPGYLLVKGFGAGMRFEPLATPAGELTLLRLEVPPLAEATRAWAAQWLGNAKFLLKQSIWFATLAPFALLGAVVVLAAVRRPAKGAADPGEALRGDRSAAALALVLLPLFHGLALLGWPACKFRYLVPLVPFAALLAAAAPPRRPGPVALLLVAPFVLAQALLFDASPTRTTYYDGIVVTDQFGRRGAEQADRASQRALEAAASFIAGRGIDAVLAGVELKSWLLAVGSEARVVQPPPADDPADLALLVDRARRAYGVDHALVAAGAQEAAWRAIPGFERALWRGGSGDAALVLIRFATP